MNRNFLKGVAGDQINVILAAGGADLRKLLHGLLHALGWPMPIHRLAKLRSPQFTRNDRLSHVYPLSLL